jgi:hypothetical protein
VKPRKQYLPFIFLAIFALILGMWAGLLRLGLNLTALPNLALAHGPLMVCGFLGVLIPLERAVAFRKLWVFLVPITSGMGWVTLLISPLISGIIITLASLGTIAILITMFLREKQIYTLTMLIGVISWAIGNIFWISGYPIFQIVYFWMSFLILTIAGERLELNRVLNLQPRHILPFCFAVLLLFVSAGIAILNLEIGARLSGLAMLMLAVWLILNDIAARNIHHTNPLTKYIAYSLFTGFIWLGTSGLIFISVGAVYAGPIYDAALHALFVGFVISMIFGHAPIIFSGIIGVEISYKPVFYIHLILLHISLFIRLLGDFNQQIILRRWGGILNEVALTLFLISIIYSIISSKILNNKDNSRETL